MKKNYSSFLLGLGLMFSANMIAGEVFTFDGATYEVHDTQVNTLTFVSAPAGLEGDYEVPGKITHNDVEHLVKIIAADAFKGQDKIRAITLPASIYNLNASSFEGCTSLESINIPEGVNNIGIKAFFGCSSLESIDLPAKLKAISNDVFNGCSSLKSVVIPELITKISNKSFNGCSSLETVVFPESLKDIVNDAFAGCSSIKTLSFPADMTSIGVRAFQNATALERVTFNGYVGSIGENAFAYAKHLVDIIYKGEVEPGVLHEKAFFIATAPERTLHVIEGKEDNFVAEHWGPNISVVADVTTGIEDMITDKGNVFATPSGVSITANENVNYVIYALNGAIQAKGVCQTKNIALPKGIYIVNIDGLNKKVAVR